MQYKIYADQIYVGYADEFYFRFSFSVIEAVKENPQRTSVSRGWWIGFKYDSRSKNIISATTGKPVSYSNWGRHRVIRDVQPRSRYIAAHARAPSNCAPILE